MTRLDPKILQTTLRETKAKWQAVGEPPREYALGYTPGPSEHALEMREMMAFTNHKQFLAAAALASPPYPSPFDWRKASGGNYITPIRDQNHCGSCVAFGSVATVEANVLVARKKPGLDIDLSEADLFFCHEGVQGGTCGTGWYVDPALDVFKKPGIVDEKCFPYSDHDQPCHKCADWKKRLTRIKNWHKVYSTTDMKQWLSKYGPLVTCFSVYSDFFSYRSGVYHHVSGPLVGGHCVSCIGYSDSGHYWICKNSWGSAWGERGFFNIAYGQVGIDAIMWAIEA